MSFSGCMGQYTLGEFEVDESLIPEQNPNSPEEEAVTTKKGIGLTLNGLDWSHKVSATKVHWHYSWGRNLSEFMPDNVEFVPMIW